MLSDAELGLLLADLESDRVERKSSAAERQKIRQAICAFANDLPGHGKPGVIFIGVLDDGTLANLVINDELLCLLADMHSDGNILPQPTMTVQKRSLAGGEVVVIEVQPSYYPPVRFSGRAWIRVGPRRAQASAEEEQRLVEKRRAKDLPFDMRPVQGATVADLDLGAFQRDYLPSAVSSDVLQRNQRSLEQQLASLRFLSGDGVPTTAGILVFGIDPLAWVPGAYLQFLRLDGTDLTDPIRHQKELNGPLPELLRQLDELLDVNISVATDVRSAATEIRHPDYPVVALQQLCRNAVMHRSYENTNAPVRIYWFNDRIEVHNPGGLYGQVTPENFGRGVTDYRNPLLAEAMKVLGYVQRFGMGIPLARQELGKNGNPDAGFQFEPGTVLTVVRRRQ